MTLALIITGVTAYGVAASPSLIYTLTSSEFLFWGCLLGELGLVYFLSSRITRLSLTTATLLFIVYSILNGVTMSFIFLVYTMSSIANVFFITAGTFGVIVAYWIYYKERLVENGTAVDDGIGGTYYRKCCKYLYEKRHIVAYG